LKRPQPSDYASFYHGYVEQIGDKNPIELLISTRAALLQGMDMMSNKELSYRYAEDKWSIKELLVHLSDTETVFAYRLLRILREDKTSLPGFDENLFAEKSNADNMDSSYIKSGLESSGHLFLHYAMQVKDKNADFKVESNGHAVTSAALIYINVGHFVHHCQVLNDRYSLSIKM
jgi:hypothetical protein